MWAEGESNKRIEWDNKELDEWELPWGTELILWVKNIWEL
jgi:hypothetical protein